MTAMGGTPTAWEVEHLERTTRMKMEAKTLVPSEGPWALPPVSLVPLPWLVVDKAVEHHCWQAGSRQLPSVPPYAPPATLLM